MFAGVVVGVRGVGWRPLRGCRGGGRGPVTGCGSVLAADVPCDQVDEVTLLWGRRDEGAENVTHGGRN